MLPMKRYRDALWFVKPRYRAVAHAWSRNEDGDLSACGLQVLEEFYIPARTPSDGRLHDPLCKRCLARLEAMREFLRGM